MRIKKHNPDQFGEHMVPIPGAVHGNPPTEALPLRKALRMHCLECNGSAQVNNKDDCTGRDCFLYPHRPWKGPGKWKSNRKAPEALTRKRKKG